MKYLVGIDVGTTNCKACVFDTEGNVKGIANGEYPGYYPNPGWAELKEEDMLPQIFGCCRKAIQDSGVNPQEIVAVSIGTIAAVTVMTDVNNRPLHNFLSWQDVRVMGSEELNNFLTKVTPEEFYKITGHSSMPFAMIPCKYLWLQENEPEVFQKTVHVCTFQDYINKIFGAEGYYTDASSAGRYCLSDTTTSEVKWSPEIVEAVGLRIEQLPTIITEAGKVIGQVKEEISQNSGLPVGCAICLGSHDQDCCNLGSGGNKAEIAIVTLGTLGTCSIISDTPVRVADESLLSNTKQGMKKFSIECLGESSASSFQWFKDALCDKGKINDSEKEVTFGMITGAANFVPMGANNITFIPSLSYATGCFLGISLGTTKEDMARAVMEGIAFEMRGNLELEMKSGIEFKEIRLAGGVAKSDVWCQMLADIFNKEIHINQSREVGCLGAAIYAGVGSGVFDNVDEGVAKMVHFGKVFYPNQERSEAYTKIYQIWVDRKNKLN